MAFMAFVEKFPELIVEGVTIEDVLSKTLPRKAKSLSRYFTLRKELFLNVDRHFLETDEQSPECIKIKQLIE